MTDMKTKAKKVFSAYYDNEAHDPAFHLTGILREVINQLQYQSFHHTEEYYLLSADDILELCNEIEKL